MGRESEEAIGDMKKTSPLTKWGASAGALAAIIGLGQLIGPPLLGWVMAGRDARIEKLEGQLAECQSGVRSLNELADTAIDASERRFQDNEVHAVELRGSIESLKNEVRVRHGDTAAASMAPAVFSEVRPRNRREMIDAISADADKRLSSARTHAPGRMDLREMIEQKVKPESDGWSDDP